MKLYEYQAKELLRAAGVPVPDGRLCRTVEDVRAAAAVLGGPVAVKAQVLAGGRGKAGGIRRAATPDEAAALAAALLGSRLLGLMVERVWVEPWADTQQELYLGYTIDARRGQVLLLLGPGGIDVETRPDAIWRTPVAFRAEPPRFILRDGLLRLRLPLTLTEPLTSVARALFRAFRDNQALLAEINPLAVTPRCLLALDARLTLDDAALERLPQVAAWVREGASEFPDESFKLVHGFDYVELDPDGDIGLISTGAGLTMTVVDLLVQAGARPINFVDIRASSMGRDPARLLIVLERLARCRNLRAVLVNIFAGITDLAAFAQALLAALETYPMLRRRVVVRAAGTAFAAAEQLWRAHGIPVTQDLEAAVAMVLEARGP